MKRSLLSAFALCLVASGVAWAAGNLTNYLPIVYPAGTTGNQSPFGTSYATLPLTGSELFPVDTQLANGQQPQSEAVSIAQAKLFVATPITLTSGQVPDASLADAFVLNLTGSGQQLPNPVNLTTGKVFRVIVNQDGTGSRALTYGTMYSWPTTGVAANAGNPVVGYLLNTAQTAPNLATSANAINILTFLYNGNSLLGSRQ